MLLLLLLLFTTTCSYKKFGRDVFRGIASKIGWEKREGEDPLDTMLRPIVIGCMTLHEDEEYLAVAKQKFWDHIKGSVCGEMRHGGVKLSSVVGTNTLSADLRGTVYASQLKRGGAEVLEALLKRMKETDLQEEQVRIIYSLGSVTEPELIQRVLELSMSADIRSQDMDTCVAGCLGTAKGM